MAITQEQQTLVTDFRGWVERRLADEGRFGAPQWSDRDDGSTLTTRWSVAEDAMIEVALRPLIPQLRVGLVTDDRWKSEEIEQGIQDSGDSMSEYLEVALSEVGLDWEDPPVEHYRHEGTWYSFITPIELGSLDELGSNAVREKTKMLIDGYANSYGAL